MKKYILKHINIGHLKNINCFLKYISDIDKTHCVYTLEEATHFESKKRAEQIKNKFKHPDLWEVKVIHECKK